MPLLAVWEWSERETLRHHPTVSFHDEQVFMSMTK
jgi:hypothetical protein